MSANDSQQQPEVQRKSKDEGFFKTPAIVKRVFNKFPLRTYAPNPLPAEAVTALSVPILFIATKERELSPKTRSHDPVCLKYQTYLHFRSVKFHAVPAAPAASPTNRLPFLLPAATSQSTSPSPITATDDKLWRYIDELSEKQTGGKSAKAQAIGLESPEVQAVLELLDLRLWDVWALQNLPTPFLHFLPTSLPFREASLWDRDPDDIFAEAEAALESLNEMLSASSAKDAGWFFNSREPGILDAAVWAYLDVLMRGGGWGEKTVASKSALVRWWERVEREWWRDE